MGEEMSDWIESHARKELARRAEMDSFIEASNSFRKVLVPLIQQELTEFRKHFPKDFVDLKVPPPEGTVQIVHNVGGGAALASVNLKWDPVRKVFAFDFPLFPKCSQTIPATVQDGTLMLDFSHTGATTQTLIEYILMPVLFPGLVGNPGVQG
jgi:hypothetical protein